MLVSNGIDWFWITKMCQKLVLRTSNSAIVFALWLSKNQSWMSPWHSTYVESPILVVINLFPEAIAFFAFHCYKANNFETCQEIKFAKIMNNYSIKLYRNVEQTLRTWCEECTRDWIITMKYRPTLHYEIGFVLPHISFQPLLKLRRTKMLSFYFKTQTNKNRIDAFFSNPLVNVIFDLHLINHTISFKYFRSAIFIYRIF